ncbi:hypothetical protein J4E90_003521 [Alternaria incomplexa]|uniref:uncharacterized protein n=1 Tax=Alternaria incomplexa TaxID=1187928 RepID=UPI00221E59B6|nr:uncharacterized protein J4E90_003521 [Alternaria incomplexa]KAI4917016.1 hypothetical protein J4E90_003521 [Alternaria incomplexa]
MDSDAWLVHDLDDTPIDPTLQSVTVQYLDPFDFALAGEATLEDDSMNLPTEHFLLPTMDLSTGQSIPTLTEDERPTIDSTEPLHGRGCFSPMRQETMQELSDLNMQLSRQLGAATSTGAGSTNIHSGLGLTALATPPEENRTLCDTVISMTQSLQTYHRLLVDIVGPNHSAIYDSHDNRKSSTVATLLATRRQINLFTISFLNIVDVSLPPDPDLQIIVLIQAVIRMVDRIGRLLGYPNDREAGSDGDGCESDTRDSVIPRHLLELMLKSEGCGNGSADRAGTKALKEEIRRLHELVYKPV